MGANTRVSGASVSRAKKTSQWKAFDQLPHTVRVALANAVFDWASYPILKWWESGRYKTAQDLAKRIAQWDADQIKKDRKKVWKH